MRLAQGHDYRPSPCDRDPLIAIGRNFRIGGENRNLTCGRSSPQALAYSTISTRGISAAIPFQERSEERQQQNFPSGRSSPPVLKARHYVRFLIEARRTTPDQIEFSTGRMGKNGQLSRVSQAPAVSLPLTGEIRFDRSLRRRIQFSKNSVSGGAYEHLP